MPFLSPERRGQLNTIRLRVTQRWSPTIFLFAAGLRNRRAPIGHEVQREVAELARQARVVPERDAKELAQEQMYERVARVGHR